MIRQFSGMILLLTLLLLAPARPAVSQTDNVKSAREIIMMLDKGNYKEVISRFDSTMTKAAPEEKLRTIWTSLINQTGKLQKELSDTTIPYNDYEIVLVTCKFEKTILDVKVIFDKESKVAGLFFAPHVEPSKESGSGGASPSDSLKGAPYISKDVSSRTRKRTSLSPARSLYLIPPANSLQSFLLPDRGPTAGTRP